METLGKQEKADVVKVVEEEEEGADSGEDDAFTDPAYWNRFYADIDEPFDWYSASEIITDSVCEEARRMLRAKIRARDGATGQPQEQQEREHHHHHEQVIREVDASGGRQRVGSISESYGEEGTNGGSSSEVNERNVTLDVLDVGCGTATHLVDIARLAIQDQSAEDSTASPTRASFRVVGCDFSETVIQTAIAFAREQYPELLSPRKKGGVYEAAFAAAEEEKEEEEPPIMPCREKRGGGGGGSGKQKDGGDGGGDGGEASRALRGKEQDVVAPLRFLVADARRLPFPSNSFDIVLDKGCLDCFISGEGARDAPLYLREIVRVLRPSGVLLCVPVNGCDIVALLHRGVVLKSDATRVGLARNPSRADEWERQRNEKYLGDRSRLDADGTMMTENETVNNIKRTSPLAWSHEQILRVTEVTSLHEKHVFRCVPLLQDGAIDEDDGAEDREGGEATGGGEKEGLRRCHNYRGISMMGDAEKALLFRCGQCGKSKAATPLPYHVPATCSACYSPLRRFALS